MQRRKNQIVQDNLDLIDNNFQNSLFEISLVGGDYFNPTQNIFPPTLSLNCLTTAFSPS